MSAAYRHTGAADAVNEVIRTIEQRGTSGLVAELNKRAGEEQQRGAKDYSAGQSQLSSAMIPYSMDFTDAYTARLKELEPPQVRRKTWNLRRLRMCATALTAMRS